MKLQTDKRTIAIIFAGGSGSRMKSASSTPKQFVPIEGKPVLVHTLERFQNHPQIDAIYLATNEDWIETVSSLTTEFNLSKVKDITTGGQSAQESAYNALVRARLLGEPDDAIVLVSDGVRPILPASLISRNIKTTVEFGNAITSIPAFETVAISTADKKSVAEVPDRNLMHVLQAPQTFYLGPLLALHERAVADDLMGHFIDQAHLADHYGAEIHLTEGLRGNIKLTIQSDYDHFRLLLQTIKLEDES